MQPSVDSQTESQFDSQPITQTELPQVIKPTENKPEIQMNAMSDIIAEENLQSGIDDQVPDASDENTLQSAITDQTDNEQSVENHSNETQPSLDQASSAVQVAAIPVTTAKTADLKAGEVKPEPLVNDVSYKCESKDHESDAPKSMSNMQKIIFGSLLLTIYMI